MKRFLRNNYKALIGLLLLVAGVALACFAGNADGIMLATFAPCSAALAANIASDCDNPRVAGYEQIGVIINKDDIDLSGVTINSSNPRILEAIAVASGKTPFAIYNNKNNPLPFNGTQTEYNSDTDRYDKTVQFYHEGIGGGNSEDVVEPLKGGDFLVILHRKDHSGDGSFQIFGWQSGLKATAQVQDEETGYWLMTMTTSEPSAEISLFKTDYATTKALFDALVAMA